MRHPRLAAVFRSSLLSLSRGWSISGGASLLLGCGLGLVLLSAILAQEATPPSSTRRQSPGSSPKATGAGSCAAFACHGGNRGEGDLRSAYTTWMALDPHSRAESVLKEARSIEIETRLATSSGRAPVRAENDRRCLGCHVSPGPDQSQATPNGTAIAEGVGCESCHGPASKWLEPHSLAPWKQLSIAKKAEQGMTSTANVETQVNLCLGCHIGGARGDVDHDLIAAGHPRLDFEFFSYFEALPKHWDVARDQQRNRPDLDASGWLFGQFASAREALGLLSLRAHAAAERRSHHASSERSPLGVWPEFAEYACNACHQPLSAATLPPIKDRQSGDLAPAIATVIPWGNRDFSMILSLLAHPRDQADHGEANSLDELRRHMESPDAEPGEVERLATEAQAQLQRYLGPAQAKFDILETRRLLERLTADGPGSRDSNWETTAQRYLGIAALSRTLERLGQPPSVLMKSTLDEMRRQLEDPVGEEASRRWRSEPFFKALERYRHELLRKTN